MKSLYKEPSKTSKQVFLDILKENITVNVCQATVDAVHSIRDYDWLLVQLSKLLEHEDGQVRGVTATCIGHLARLCPKKADREQLLSTLSPHLSDESIIGQVEDAIDDIDIFLKNN